MDIPSAFQYGAWTVAISCTRVPKEGSAMKKELPALKKVSLIFETDDKAALKEIIEAAGGTVIIEYASVDMLAAEVPLTSLEDVLKSPHIVAIYKDKIQKPF